MIFFDYQQASDSLTFYEVKDIPSISVGTIPSEVFNVTFDCDLSNVPTTLEKAYNFQDSLLFKSLGI